jgi:hypothetical protein
VCYKAITRYARLKEKFSLLTNLPQILSLLGLILALSLSANGQHRGSLKGVVHNSAGVPVAGVQVLAINQVTSRASRAITRPDGQFSLRLPSGAYRVSVVAPYFAKFDKDKIYGEFALPRGDTLENVIIDPDRETVLDFQIEEKKPLPAAGSPAKPTNI